MQKTANVSCAAVRMARVAYAAGAQTTARTFPCG